MIFYNFFILIKKKLRKIYQNSRFYEKKISKTFDVNFEYKPSPHLLSSIIKYQNKKYKIENFSIDSIWKKKLSLKDYKKLNNFYWFFSLDLKSSKKDSQKIINNWILNNEKYKKDSWEFDITAKRIISWLSNHQLTYEDSNKEYRLKFDHMVQKQTNHLLNELKNSKEIGNKIIGCVAIILAGLAYRNQKIYLDSGLGFLKNIIKHSIDNQGFPKSRSIQQLISYLKYFILIREWFKEAQITIPDQINETINYLGQGYAFVWQKINSDILFNGNNISNNFEFDNYLKRFGYTFKNENRECGGYVVLKNKKISLIMDIGNSPNKNFSKNYQAGVMSVEIISNGKKLITNCGYHNNENLKLNELSKSTATHNTLIIDDNSSCHFKKNENNFVLKDEIKILKKEIIFEKNYWKIKASHNGYQKKYNSIHEREIEFFPDQNRFVGKDKILNKHTNFNVKFDIRFHLEPGVKLMKTQDNKTILIELMDEGWKFTCDNFNINIDNGLYFGNKNSYIQNQNIFISGIANKQNENINWQLIKI